MQTPLLIARQAKLRGRRQLRKQLRMMGQQRPAAATWLELLAQESRIRRAWRPGLKRLGKQLHIISQASAAAAAAAAAVLTLLLVLRPEWFLGRLSFLASGSLANHPRRYVGS